MVVAPEVSGTVDAQESSAMQASHSGKSSLLKRKSMKAVTLDDDARVFIAERKGALSFLPLRAAFRTTEELLLAESPRSTIVLNRSFPQAFLSITSVDISVGHEDPNNSCLSFSFKLSLSPFSTAAASFVPNAFPNSVMSLLLKSTVRIYVSAAMIN